MNKCNEVIHSTQWPFMSNDLTTQKIFNDLVQYHVSYLGNAKMSAISEDMSAPTMVPSGQRSEKYTEGSVSYATLPKMKSGAAVALGLGNGAKKYSLQPQHFHSIV